MSEHEEDYSDENEDKDYEQRSGRVGQSPHAGASGGTSRRQDRERSSSGRRDHSASRERSISPRSDRRSQASSAPPKPSKVTLVKSRKNEGEPHSVLVSLEVYQKRKLKNTLHEFKDTNTKYLNFRIRQVW